MLASATVTMTANMAEDPETVDETSESFQIAPVHELPTGIVPAARRAIEEAAQRSGVWLDASEFTPLAAARREWAGRAFGVEVVRFLTWRAVGEIRIGRSSGLLVAELTLVDDEPGDDALAREGVALRVVAFATPADAERIALEPVPGELVPQDADDGGAR